MKDYIVCSLVTISKIAVTHALKHVPIPSPSVNDLTVEIKARHANSASLLNGYYIFHYKTLVMNGFSMKM